MEKIRKENASELNSNWKGENKEKAEIAKIQEMMPFFFLSFYQETALEKRVEGVSSPRFPNWGRQVHGHGVNVPIPLLSAAASSGFASCATIGPSATLPLLSPQSMSPAMQPPPTKSTTNTSCFYSFGSSNQQMQF